MLAALKSSASSNEMMWHDKCLKMEARIHDLTLTVSIMEEEKLKHEKEFQDTLKIEKERLAQVGKQSLYVYRNYLSFYAKISYSEM